MNDIPDKNYCLYIIKRYTDKVKLNLTISPKKFVQIYPELSSACFCTGLCYASGGDFNNIDTYPLNFACISNDNLTDYANHFSKIMEENYPEAFINKNLFDSTDIKMVCASLFFLGMCAYPFIKSGLL